MEMSGASGIVERVVKGEAALLDEVLAHRSIRALYQPIVELDSGRVIAWEALARGPQGSALELPDKLFGTAARRGRTVELDHCCRVAAIDGAIAAGLERRQELFVNVEPDTAGAPVPAFLEAGRDRAQAHLRITVEITERELTRDPGALVALVADYRSRGWGIALDDIGVDPRSVSLMPLLRPDVIKLDMSFVQQPLTRERARIVHAVVAEAEHSGARVLAEGIETAEQVVAARTLGAELGQGWYFGRPGELRPGPDTEGTGRTRATVDPADDTPYEHLSRRRPSRPGTKRQLLEMSLSLEDEALAQGSSAVLLSTFQEAAFFPRKTQDRYAGFAERLAFVGALAADLGAEPARGVRGAALDPRETLLGEWDVVVLGPHFAGAFVSRDLGDQGPDHDRRFDYVVTHDRDLVVAAATRLMRRVAPRLGFQEDGVDDRA